MASISASEARTNLPALLDRVTAGEEVTITRYGTPVAVMVSPESLRSRRSGGVQDDAERVRVLIEQGWSVGIGPSGGIPADRAEALIADVRASRDGR